MNDNATMAEFAEGLWQNYIKPKITQEFNSTITYFKATVIANNGDGTIDVRRPFDTTITVQCANSTMHITAGKTVTVLQFGKNNAKNYLAIGEGDAKDAFGRDTEEYTPVVGKPTGNQTPDFGDSVTVSQISQASSGQISAVDRTITIPSTEASETSAGLFSASNFSKLQGIEDNAEVNVQADWDETDTNSDAYIKNKPAIPVVPTYTAFEGKPTANQTPSFGGTFTLSQIEQSTTGQVSGTDRTVTIPNTVASTSANGLMSSGDKTALDKYAQGGRTFYATCSTEAATAAKVATITPAVTGYALQVGDMVTVKYSATNTASNPTLNINGTGAKSVWYNTAVVTTSVLNAAGTNGRPIQYVYDGTNWVFMGWSVDNNNTYTNMSQAEASAGTATTARSISAAVLATTIEEHVPLKGVKRNGTLLAIDSNKTVDVEVPTATSDLTNDSNFVSDANYVHTDNNFTTTEKDKLAGIEAGAQVNQNAFSNVKVGSTTVAADTATDTLTLTAGSNVTLTPNATSDTITIAATDTTYSDATQTTAGLMSAEDKTKLDNLEVGATNLLRNTRDFVITTDATAQGRLNTNIATVSGEYRECEIAYYDNTAATSSYVNMIQWINIPAILSGEYVFSFWAKVGTAVNNKIQVFFYGATGYVQVATAVTSQGASNTSTSGGIYFNPTTEWERYWVKWTLKDTGDISIPKYVLIRVHYGADLYVAGCKLETGNMPTYWSPAPEDDVNVSGEGSSTYYGTCTSAADAQAKVATLSGVADYTLKVGDIVGIKFSNTNTYSATAAAPVTLNVNGTGAKNIYYNVSGTPTGTNTKAFGYANRVNYYMYDGTYWVFEGASIDDNTTYGNMSQTEATAGTATTARTISAKVLNDTIEAKLPTYTQTTGKPTANQTPAFGATFTISQVSQATSGQMSVTDRTVKIPDTEASATSSGLMTSSQFGTVDSLATNKAMPGVYYTYVTGSYSYARMGDLVVFNFTPIINNIGTYRASTTYQIHTPLLGLTPTRVICVPVTLCIDGNTYAYGTLSYDPTNVRWDLNTSNDTASVTIINNNIARLQMRGSITYVTNDAVSSSFTSQTMVYVTG